MKFDAEQNNMNLFSSFIEKAECLKYLVDALLFVDLTLSYVKKDKGLRNYSFWLENQIKKLFSENPIQVYL